MRTYSAVFFSALSLILTLLVGRTTFQNTVQCATRGLHPHFTCFLRVDCEWMWVWWLWGWEWKGARFVLKSTYFTAAEYWPTPCLPLSGICSRSYVSEGAESVGGIQKKKKNKQTPQPTNFRMGASGCSIWVDHELWFCLPVPQASSSAETPFLPACALIIIPGFLLHVMFSSFSASS